MQVEKCMDTTDTFHKNDTFTDLEASYEENLTKNCDNSPEGRIKTQHIHAILDRSGSMTGKTEEVMNGFQSQLEELQSDEKFLISLSVKMFSTDQAIILEEKEVKKIDKKELEKIKEEYIPRGQTALRDALGDLLMYLNEIQSSTSKFDDVVIYVFTDGLENASRNQKYTGDALKKIIETSEENFKIKVLYVGSNQDSILSASHLGVKQGRAMNFNESCDGIINVYRALSSAAQRSRECEEINFTSFEKNSSMV